MSKLPVISKSLYWALILVLVTLTLVVLPVHVVAGSRTAGQPAGSLREGLDGWASFLSDSGWLEALSSNQAMRVWLPPARPVGAPRARPLLDAISTVQIEGPVGTEVTAKSLTADEAFTFYAVSYNGVTSTQEATWTLSSDIGSLSTQVGVSTTLNATMVGSADLKAQLVMTPSFSTTARITVMQGDLHHIVIRSAADGGGIEVGDYTMTIYDTYPMWAAGYDADGNFWGDVPTTTWELVDGLSGVLQPTSGISTIFTPAPAQQDSGRIRASYSGLEDLTGLFTVQAPQLIISKSDYPDPVSAGEPLQYTIVLNNIGDAAARNVRITETYDSRVSYFSAFPDPPINPPLNNVWEFPTLERGASRSILITVRVNEYMVDRAVLISSVEAKGDKTNKSSAFAETTVNAPRLVLAKSDTPDPVVALDPLVYTLVYRNVGHAVASGLNITDVVPANTSFSSCRGLPCSYSPSDRVVTWIDESGLAAGASRSLTLVVDVHRNLDTGTLLTNRARVRKVGEPRYSAVSQIDTTVVSSPSLSLSISNGTSAVEAGDPLEYAVSYNNNGTGRAYDTTIVVTPPSSQYVEGVGCDPPSACQLQGGRLVFDIGMLPSGTGGSGTVTMVATVRDPLPAGARSITASAEINTITPGDPSGDNSTQDVDPIATRPDLQVLADYHFHTPYPGKRITYTLQYGNKGHIATTGVVLTASLPKHTTYEDDASSAWEATGSGDYVYTVGPLDYNEGGTLLFVVTLPSESFTTAMCNFDAAFEVSDSGISGDDSNPDNNAALAPLGVPDMVVDSVEVNWRSLLSGERGPHVTATLRNLGSVWACNPIPGPDDPPDFCAGFWIDLYFNPDPVPPSYPSDTFYGQVAEAGIKIPPNSTGVVPFVFDSTAILASLGDPTPLYIRVDNLDGNPERPFGSVPECNELNNVFGPIEQLNEIYLPVMMRGY